MRRRAFLTVPLLLVLLWSCGENSLLLGGVDEPAQIEVETISSGAVLSGDASVPLAISRDPVYTGDESTLDRLIVELLDHEGTVLAEQSYDSVDDATELPPVELPGLEEGLYSIRTVYLDGEQVVSSKTVPFFVTEGAYRILGLTSYPASSYPEADGLLRVSLDVPAASDPFLVWWIDGRVVQSGYLSQTGRTIAVLAPASEGVFPVRVEIYPAWPEDADFRSVRAPATYSTELYVSRSPSLSGTDLAPSRSYFALYHLRGTFGDDGARADWFPSRDFTAEPFGDPQLDARSDVFGYALDGSSGLRIDGGVWPVYRGELAPVSFSFRLLADRLGPRATLMRVATRAGDLASVVVDDLGRVGLRLAMVEGDIWSALPVISRDEPELVTISIVPGATMGSVAFFAGGQLVSSVEIPGLSIEAIPPPRIIEGADAWSLIDGTTTIGAETGGFVGIVDEFGVFFRGADNEPATNTALYVESMRSTHGARLVYASSFDDAAEIDSLIVDGRVAVEGGSLVLEAASQVSFPVFPFSDEDLVLESEIAAPEGADLIVIDAASGREITRSRLGAADEARDVTITLTHGDGGIVVNRGDRTTEVALDGDRFEGIRVTIVAGPDGSVDVRSLASWRDRPQIPRRLFEVDG